MNNFAEYISIDRAVEFAIKSGDHRRPSAIRDEFERMASDAGTCCNCDQDVWRYGDVGMCFTCTTGESDASEDYELAPMGAALEKLRVQESLLALVGKPKTEKVSCPICKKRVAKVGLQAHHKAKHGGPQPKART